MQHFNYLLYVLPVRPELTDTFACKQSRHPVLDRILIQPPVPNNIVSFLHECVCVSVLALQMLLTILLTLSGHAQECFYGTCFVCLSVS